MKINIQTPVSGTPTEIIKQFDRELFRALAPPGAKVEIVRFDGSKKGDTVHIRLTLLGFFKQDWVSKITDETVGKDLAFFTDKGTILPFFLKAWKHNHIVESRGTHSAIIDDIEFQTPFILMDWLMYPLLYFQFAWRRPIYRKYFGEVVKT